MTASVRIASSEPLAGGRAVAADSQLRSGLRRYLRNWAAVAAAGAFALMVLAALAVPVIYQGDPYKVDFTQTYQGPSMRHLMGTDQYGRDMLVRTALGARVSIAIGLAATGVIMVIGLAYGALSGFIGGRLDDLMMRFLDALYGLPYLPFAIIALQIFQVVNIFTMVVALSIASWFTAARIVRGQVMSLKENDYVRAARAVGARWYRVLWRHILPNTMGVLIIAIFLELPAVILGEAFLSFIGLGINPPEASLGSMAQEGMAAYRSHPHVIVIPSLAIAALVLCANFIADGLRDALDPQARDH
jgi:oligopeptide transport system permease protein